MIHLSTGPRQRHKITIFLEETTLPYSIKPINIGAGDQVCAGVSDDLAQQPDPGDCGTISQKMVERR